MPDPGFRSRLKTELLGSIPYVAIDTVDALRIGIVADTHCDDNRPLPEAVLAALAGSDLIVHCGDITAFSVLDRLESLAPVIAVRGDTDRGDDPRLADRARVIEAGRFRIGVTFDLKLPPGVLPGEDHPQTRELIQKTFAGQVDMVVAAATHVGSLHRWLDTWILNPGSPTLPANGIKSVAVVEIDDDLRPRLVEL
jgi:hypothetical protein